jgi:hypothetical protein
MTRGTQSHTHGARSESERAPVVYRRVAKFRWASHVLNPPKTVATNPGLTLRYLGRSSAETFTPPDRSTRARITLGSIISPRK